MRARNASPLTLDGTNTYIVEGWVVDPGPVDPDHRDAILGAAGQGVRGIVLTHRHADHAEGAPALSERAGVAVVAPHGDEELGPFRVLATPGHTADSVCLLRGGVCFTGDTVLGSGSVFISPGEGSLADYLRSLRRLRSLGLEVLCPGHGPLIRDPATKLDEYMEHRLERERKLLAALEAGARTHDQLLDAAWADVPAALRAAASMTLQAHLDKLCDEGRLPPSLGGVR